MSDMPCVNSIMLAKHLEEEEKAERDHEQFLSEIEPFCSVISEQAEEIKNICKSYGYDFDVNMIEDWL